MLMRMRRTVMLRRFMFCRAFAQLVVYGPVNHLQALARYTELILTSDMWQLNLTPFEDVRLAFLALCP
jgi:hypothetical protein